MIRKARRRFIITGMAATLVVTVALIFAINMIYSVQSDRNQDQVLIEMITFDELNKALVNYYDLDSVEDLKDLDWGESSGESAGDSSGESSGDSSGDSSRRPADEDLSPPFEGAPPIPDEIREQLNLEDESFLRDIVGIKPDRNSARNQYSGRYFSLTVDSDGRIEVGNHNQEIPTEEELAAIVDIILKRGGERGYIDDYRYIYLKFDDSSIISFLDCTTELNALRRLLLISCCIGGAGLLIAFLFIFYVSGRIVMPLKISMEKQKRFITDAGHELKTPLSVIGTNMDILSMDLGNNEWVDGTKKQVTKLRKLVNYLISLSKLDEGNMVIESTRFDLTAAAQESVDPYVGMAQMEDVDIAVSIEDGLFTSGDEMQLRQLMTILCDNAVKYAQGDMPIEVRLYRDGKKAVFETANGWDRENAPKDLHQMFDRFYRSDPSRNNSGVQRGYGLGLSIAEGIAERNKVSVNVYEDAMQRLVFKLQFLLA